MRFTPKEFEKFENELIELGYRKFNQKQENSDFQYFKNKEYTVVDGEKDGGYLCGLYFYDWSKYPQFTEKVCISCSLNFILNPNDIIERLDITITDDEISIARFEMFCKNFYKFFKNNKL
jgi:hypothetical protein